MPKKQTNPAEPTLIYPKEIFGQRTPDSFFAYESLRDFDNGEEVAI